MNRSTRTEAVAAFFRPPLDRPAGERAAHLGAATTFLQARVLIQAYYAVVLYFAVGNLFSWQGYLEAGELAPLWPVRWLRWIDTETGIGMILAFHLVAGLVGATLNRFRTVRIIVFVSLLEFVAFKFSFGSINHGDHLGVLISFVLIALPRGWYERASDNRRTRVATALVFSTCQSLILLTYSMAGFWKLGGVIRQVLAREVHSLHPKGLAMQIAAKLLDSDTTSIAGPWLIEHYWVGWPLMIATLYLELFALWIVFRPSLHRAWGAGLILFHVSSHLTMEVGFPQNVLWLALFLVLSPFAPARWSWSRALRELPIAGPRLPLGSPGR